MGPYDDILGLERPVSRRHVPMPRADRAKQFMPFAALRGYTDTLEVRRDAHEHRMQEQDAHRETDEGDWTE